MCGSSTDVQVYRVCKMICKSISCAKYFVWISALSQRHFHDVTSRSHDIIIMFQKLLRYQVMRVVNTSIHMTDWHICVLENLLCFALELQFQPYILWPICIFGCFCDLCKTICLIISLNGKFICMSKCLKIELEGCECLQIPVLSKVSKIEWCYYRSSSPLPVILKLLVMWQ